MKKKNEYIALTVLMTFSVLFLWNCKFRQQEDDDLKVIDSSILDLDLLSKGSYKISSA